MGRGTKEKSSSEKTLKETTKADGATGDNSTESEHTGDPGVPAQAPSRMARLEAIIASTCASRGEWPGAVLRATIGRFGRVPRFGWDRLYAGFLKIHPSDMAFAEFKRRAEAAITNTDGIQCSRRKFAEEATKKTKTIDAYIEEATLYEAKLLLEVKQQFTELLQKFSGQEIQDVERTAKFTTEQTDTRLLGLINQTVGDHVANAPPHSMTDAARLLQTAQHLYSQLRFKKKKRSTWRESIEKKISLNKENVELLKRAAEKREELTKRETSRARRAINELGLGLHLESKRDTTAAIHTLEERVRVYESKIASADSRRAFRADNRNFELHRGRFYRHLKEGERAPHGVPKDEVREFWAKMWLPEEEKPEEFGEYLDDFVPEDPTTPAFPSQAEFLGIVKRLPNWKAAGPDGIFNFFIKKMTSLHSHLYRLTRDVCIEGREQEPWFYRGLTFLLPKGEPKTGSEFRPITCMSNLYKLTTKCVTSVMQLDVELRGLLAENQLGTVARVQGAKEQALLNIAVAKENSNALRTSWYDVAKAYDSVGHQYLLSRIEKLNFPPWVLSFLRSITSKWEVEVIADREKLLRKRIERGILQGDSLSPLLFVLCMDPLSRRLNAQFPMVPVPTETGTHNVNHLLFVDDLKVYAKTPETLRQLDAEVEKFTSAIGLNINRAKSATNEPTCTKNAELLEGPAAYKYLGVLEDSGSRPTRATFEKIRKELLGRVEKLCATRLNGKNLFQAINEHAVSLVNYYVGLLPLEPSDFQRLDHDVRQTLIRKGVHKQPANLERLYLPRSELGRGLHRIEFRSEQMLLGLRNYLERHAPTSTRRAAILKQEREHKTHLALIGQYLMARYSLSEVPDVKTLHEIQRATLYSEIEKKSLHQKLYKLRTNELVDYRESSLWLRRANVQPTVEAKLCLLQDRNLFQSAEKCSHCRTGPMTVDHLATRCDRMLHDYTRRHNEVVRCIHLSLCVRYGLKAFPKLRSHSVQEVVENEEARICVDTTVRTAIRQEANRPDIVVYDKKRKEILIVEVGVTSQDRLQTVEAEKRRKYDILANKLVSEMGYKRARIMPFVMTWDGLVTIFNAGYAREIGLSDATVAYTQAVVLRRTLQSISFDHRRGVPGAAEVAPAGAHPEQSQGTERPVAVS